MSYQVALTLLLKVLIVSGYGSFILSIMSYQVALTLLLKVLIVSGCVFCLLDILSSLHSTY